MEKMNKDLERAPTPTCHKILLTCWSKLREFPKTCVSLSGGADSDVMLDAIERANTENADITYCFFDTGIEYQATKEHLDYLEKKYNITIQRKRPKYPVPLAVKQFGVPFLSKTISLYIKRLQKHNFQWEDEAYEVLKERYPRCLAALKWWCNEWGEKSSFNISRNAYLKEFMIAYPPDFKISELCCDKAKKSLVHEMIREGNYSVSCNGVRRSEGGQRAASYHNCFTPAGDRNDIANYRPLFFMTDEDKAAYEQAYDVTHSRCYTEYGMKRTGCAGCPLNSRFEEELEIIKQHEPKLYKAVNNIFGKSYEYTRAYRRFKEEMKKKKNEK